MNFPYFIYLRKCHKKKKKKVEKGWRRGKKGGTEKMGKQTNWRPGIEPETSALKNLSKCHKNNSSLVNTCTVGNHATTFLLERKEGRKRTKEKNQNGFPLESKGKREEKKREKKR